MRALAAGVTGRTGQRSDGQVRDAVTELLDRLTAARELLTAPSSGVSVVTTAEHVVVAEARRAYTALSLHGYRVNSVIVNRLVPADADGSWADQLRTAQAAELSAVTESFAGLPVRRATIRAVEPSVPRHWPRWPRRSTAPTTRCRPARPHPVCRSAARTARTRWRCRCRWPTAASCS